VFEGTFGFYARGWRPGSSQVLMTETRGEDGNNLYLLDTVTGEAETLFKPEVSSEYQSFAWLPDGSGFYLSTNHDREFAGLAFYDLGARELRFLRTPEHDIGNVVLFGGDRFLAFTTNENGYDRLHLMDRRLRSSDQRVPAPELPPGVYNLAGARDAAALVVRVSGPRTPGEAWLWRPGEEAAERVLDPTLAGIDPDVLVVPEAVSFEAQDGVMLHGLLYRPAGDNRRPPLMLKVHGGPTGQARPRFDGVSQYLVGRGYAVFDFNFRGSTGYGKTFARLDNGRLRPNAVRDIEDAVGWLGDSVDVDPTRMAIMGGSYGGYLTNAAVGEYPGLFKAAVSFVGVSDWVRALEQASPALKASDRVEYGDITDPDDRAFFAEISPIAKAHRIRTPMVVVHGANDPRDPVTESDHLVQAVREQEVEVRYLRFADEGHGLRKLGNRITAYREIADFLDEKLK
jgi:dipeptidyl aminopeptidase/acylaminoacyl peptidase